MSLPLSSRVSVANGGDALAHVRQQHGSKVVVVLLAERAWKEFVPDLSLDLRYPNLP